MLCIIFVAMMHNVFPHAHHQHDVHDAAIALGDLHSHGDHHHHSDESENDDEQGNFFDYLLQNHSHAKHTHQYTPAIVEGVKSVKQLVLKVFCACGSTTVDLNCIEFGINRYVLLRSHVPDQPCLLSLPLRGPPSLG